MALATFDHRSEEIAFTSCIIVHYQGYDLLVGVSDHGLAGLWRIGGRCPGIQKTQKIVDLRNGAYSGPRIVSRGLLFYGDDRAQTCD